MLSILPPSVQAALTSVLPPPPPPSPVSVATAAPNIWCTGQTRNGARLVRYPLAWKRDAALEQAPARAAEVVRSLYHTCRWPTHRVVSEGSVATLSFRTYAEAVVGTYTSSHH